MLAAEIGNALQRLKPVETLISLADGQVFREICDKNGRYVRVKLDKTTCGFVIDTKPNLTVSCVLPWLFFGAQDVTHDNELPPLLNKSHAIDLILSIGVPPPPPLPNTTSQRSSVVIPTVFFDAYDIPEFDIRPLCERCIGIIENIRLSNKRIYVHCNAGISRSATVVVAYVMFRLKMNLQDALNFVKHLRPTINPNVGFLQQLKTLEQIYLADNGDSINNSGETNIVDE